MQLPKRPGLTLTQMSSQHMALHWQLAELPRSHCLLTQKTTIWPRCFTACLFSAVMTGLLLPFSMGS